MSTSRPKQKLRVLQKEMNVSPLLSEMALLATLWCQEERKQHFQGWVKRQKAPFTVCSKSLGSPMVSLWWIPLYTEQDPAREGDMSALLRAWCLLFIAEPSFLARFPMLLWPIAPSRVQKSHLQALHKEPSGFFEKNLWEWGSAKHILLIIF